MNQLTNVITDPTAILTRQQTARFGWVRDRPDFRDQLFTVSSQAIQALPASVDLRPQCPPVYDQGPIGSCTANAIAAAIQFDRLKNHQLPDFIPSRLFIYYNERVIEGDVGFDKGAQLRDGIKTVNKLGVCPETDWPYDARPATSDGGPFPAGSRASVKPTATCYTDASLNKVTAYQRLVQTLSQLKGCLAQGLPFVFGFTVYDSLFENYGLSTQRLKVSVPLPSGTDTPIGGHAVMCVGYEEDAQLFIVRNSWGPNEGEGGYFYMPYAYLTDNQLASDFWVIQTVA